MQILTITPTREDWLRQHAKILKFVFEHGGNQAARAEFILLARLTAEQLAAPGTSLMAATVRCEDGESLAGVSFVSGYGTEGCLVVVHPLYRGRGIGTSLLASQLRQLGTMRCEALLSRLPFVKMCFRAGLHAVAVHQGAAGEPALVMEGPCGDPDGASITLTQEGDPLCRYPC
ncbi:GNAT family N-acetyltransferase [Paenibacillus sp. Y412MC10]|uniref:GNAT family N-acetyltransferase n=1 Tax=Geobacillus sp. (strain Y412MC10) TaxID=481743 RepID=UPI00119EA373|nr:GNAT family N-acetyltransferase [Paenibacillus sp. Y412MC10]